MLLSDSSKEFPWWQSGVIYQIYPRSFKDTNGDGIGDLAGIIEKLDYLNDGTNRSLGIDAVWLSPFYPSPMADFGYDVSDYCNVHPMFGDLDTFDLLVEEAHKRKIKVIVDYVPNHTSDQHPWFLESRSSRNNPKRDWYIWRDPKPGGKLPNNWGAVFGGSAWEWDESTGQHYFHHFLKEQPDLNWRNPEVKEAMLDVLRFWLDRGVDGFRMDVVGMILKDPDFRDNPPNPITTWSLPETDIFSRQKNIYNMDLDEVHEIISEFRKLLDSYGNRSAIGEVWGELPRWIKYYGVQGQGLHLPFNFRLIHLPWNMQSIRKSVDELEAALPEFAWPNYVLGNHDVPRLASRIGQEQARVAAMLLLTLRGTPTLYYGDEIGMENGIITPENLMDPQGIRLGIERSRDVSRTPMQWDSSRYGGFSTTEPWLPVEPEFRSRNTAAMSDDPNSLLNLYRRLLHLRKEIPALSSGSYRSLESNNNDVFLYMREHSTGRYLIALNFSEQTQSISIPEERGETILSTSMDRSGTGTLDKLPLRGNEGIIIKI